MKFSQDSISKAWTEILTIIGSPTWQSKNLGSSSNNLSSSPQDLYALASRNKIGLLFLQSYMNISEYFPFKQILDNELKSYKQLIETAQRASAIIEDAGAKYAVIKSVMPFPAVPNDVDIIIFGTLENYELSLEALRRNSFESLGEPAPLEDCVHDVARGGNHIDPNYKDPFDVDVYREIGASHIIYMDKNKLEKYCLNITIDNKYSFNVLDKPAELAVYMFHSIYPERIYTLLLYYCIIYTVSMMNKFQLDQFVDICLQNKIGGAALICLQVTENIQREYLGTVDPKLVELRERFGAGKDIKITSMPYRYPLSTIINSFWTKRSDKVFSKSVMRQIFQIIKDKEIRRHVAKEYFHRKHRDTY